MTKVRFLGISLLTALAMFAMACTSEEEPTSTPILEPTATGYASTDGGFDTASGTV